MLLNMLDMTENTIPDSRRKRQNAGHPAGARRGAIPALCRLWAGFHGIWYGAWVIGPCRDVELWYGVSTDDGHFGLGEGLLGTVSCYGFGTVAGIGGTVCTLLRVVHGHAGRFASECALCYSD